MIGCIDCSIFTLDVNYLCFPKDIPKNIQQIDVEDVRDSTISKANSIHTRNNRNSRSENTNNF